MSGRSNALLEDIVETTSSIVEVGEKVDALSTTLSNLEMADDVEETTTVDILTSTLNLSEDTRGLLTHDLAVERVLGSQRLLNQEDRLKVDPRSQDVTYRACLSGANQVFQVPCAGFSCLTLQIIGTWTTTITFEGSLDGGAFATIYGVNVGAIAPALGTTAASGIYRFAVAGLKIFQVRFSTYASGSPVVIATLSVQPNVTALPGDVYGSQTNALSQKASTFELNTYDTNVVAATMLQPAPIPLAPVAPAISAATTFARPFTAPPAPRQHIISQILGSERQPLAQETNTGRFLVSYPEEIRLLEAILFQLQCLNMQTAGEKLPSDFINYS